MTILYSQSILLISIYIQILFVTLIHGYPATQSTLSNIQSQRIDVYTTTTTNSINYIFTITYSSSLTLTSSGSFLPQGALALTKIDFIPTGIEAFWCSTQNVGINSLSISCTVKSVTTVNMLSYFYIVFGTTQYSYTLSGNNYNYMSASQISATGANSTSGFKSYLIRSSSLPSSSQIQSFAFLRGFQSVLIPANIGIILSMTANSKNIIFQISSGSSGKRINSTSITRVQVSVLSFDIAYLQFRKNIKVFQAVSTFENGSQISSPPTGLNLNLNILFIGLKGFTLSQNTAYSFDFNYNTSTDVGFPATSPYNQFQYVWLTSYSCLPGSYLQRSQKQCKTTRNGCSNYYQYIANSSIGTITAFAIHKSLKMFAVSSQYQIRIYRHDGFNFLLYTSLNIAIQTSQILKIVCSQDFSRMAVLCAACGLFIYTWNGTEYISQYMLPFTSTFTDFSIREDFKMINIMYSGKRATLVYDNEKRDYIMGPQMTSSSTDSVYVNYQKKEGYFFYSSNLDHANYDQNLKIYVPYTPRTYIWESSGTIRGIMSGNQKVLAYEFSRTSDKNSIKIYHYDQTQHKFIYHSEILSISQQNYGVVNYLKLSYSGLKLLIKAHGAPVQNFLIFERSFLADPFTLVQMIGSQVQSFTTEGLTTNGIVDASDNFQLILGADSSRSTIIYYCPSSIANIAQIYQIPIASPLWTEIKSQINQLKGDITNIKDSINIILPIVAVIICVLLISTAVLGVLLWKIMKQKARISSQKRQNISQKSQNMGSRLNFQQLSTLNNLKSVQCSDSTIIIQNLNLKNQSFQQKQQNNQLKNKQRKLRKKRNQKQSINQHIEIEEQIQIELY